MAATTSSATVIGSTGLVGGHILRYLLASPTISGVSTLIRRPIPSPPADPHSKLHPTVNPTTDSWPAVLPDLLAPASSTSLFSALGATRANAGGLASQRKIDYDLNLALARAAHAAGVTTYVLISSAGAAAGSWSAYLAMKGQLEEDVVAIGFEKCVIVRPGLIMGGREKPRWNEAPLQTLANMVAAVRPGLKDAWAQDADVIARAAVRGGVEQAVWEGRKTVEGKNGGKVWYMGQAEIMELGKE